MRAVIQRVSSASVAIDGVVKSSIGPGLMVLLGVGHEDGQEDLDWLVKKISGLRTTTSTVANGLCVVSWTVWYSVRSLPRSCRQPRNSWRGNSPLPVTTESSSPLISDEAISIAVRSVTSKCFSVVLMPWRLKTYNKWPMSFSPLTTWRRWLSNKNSGVFQEILTDGLSRKA